MLRGHIFGRVRETITISDDEVDNRGWTKVTYGKKRKYSRKAEVESNGVMRSEVENDGGMWSEATNTGEIRSEVTCRNDAVVESEVEKDSGMQSEVENGGEMSATDDKVNDDGWIKVEYG